MSSRKTINKVSNCLRRIWNNSLGYTSRLKTGILQDYITQQDCLWCTPWYGTHILIRRSLCEDFYNEFPTDQSRYRAISYINSLSPSSEARFSLAHFCGTQACWQLFPKNCHTEHYGRPDRRFSRCLQVTDERTNIRTDWWIYGSSFHLRCSFFTSQKLLIRWLMLFRKLLLFTVRIIRST